MSADNFPYVEEQPAEIYFDGKWHRGQDNCRVQI